MQATAADYTPTQTQAPAVACVPVKQKRILRVPSSMESSEQSLEGQNTSPVQKRPKRVEAVQAEDKKGSGRPHSEILVSKEANKKAREGLSDLSM